MKRGSKKSERERYYLSESGVAGLHDSLERLERERRENLERLKSLKDQQSDGMSLEDSAYIQALSTAHYLDSEIERISHILANAAIITGPAVENEVGIGSRVQLEADGGHKFEYIIVNSIEADPSQGKISDASPLGRQLLGKRLKDTVLLLSNSAKRKPLLLRLVAIHKM